MSTPNLIPPTPRWLMDGKVVPIFESPVEMDRYEGEAMLIRRIDKLEKKSLIQRWRVRFVGTDEIVDRVVWRGEKIEEDHERWTENVEKRSNNWRIEDEWR